MANIHNLFKFIESKRKQYRVPFEYKLSNNLPISNDDELIITNLNLYNSNAESLPDNLTVKGALHLNGSKIKSLPNNLTVGDYLDLTNSKIKSLPNDLTINGTLDLTNSKIKSLPNDLKVGMHLVLNNMSIDSIPNNLTVGGNLEFIGSAIADNYDIYSPNDILKMIEDKGGSVDGRIIT
jgi:hypothetical protein